MRDTLVERFKARAPSGEVVELRIYQEWIDASSFDDPHAKIPGMKRIVDEDGMGVNYIDDNHFHWVVRGVDLERIG